MEEIVQQVMALRNRSREVNTAHNALLAGGNDSMDWREQTRLLKEMQDLRDLASKLDILVHEMFHETDYIR